MFWLALFAVMISHSFGLFYYRWNEWVFRLTSTVGISWKIILPIIIFVKYYYFDRGRLNRVTDVLRPKFKAFILYVFFMLVIGFVFGYDLKQAVFLLQFTTPYLLFLIIPRSFSKQELFHFNKVIFAWSIILFFQSIIDTITGGALMKIFFFGSSNMLGNLFFSSMTRIMGGIYLVFYSLIISLYYLVNNQKQITTTYLWIVIAFNVMFIINSATRGWMLAAGFLLIIYMVFYSKKLLISFRGIALAIVLIGIFFFLIPPSLKDNFSQSYKRFSTVESIAEGDMTAEGTADRWTVRGPKVLTRFDESPIFGFGYSKVTNDFYDNHVGNHLLLLSGGIIGLLIVYFTVIGLIVYFYRKNFTKLGEGFFVFGIALISIMLIHSTSRNMLAFLMPVDTAFFLGLIFNHVNAAYSENLNKFYKKND